MGPFFYTDKDGKWWMTVSPAPGYGGPNYVLQRQLRFHYAPLIDDAKDRKAQQADRVALLKNVLSDAYFHGLRDPKDVVDPDPVQQDKSGVGLNSGGGTGQPGGQPVGPGAGSGPGVRPRSTIEGEAELFSGGDADWVGDIKQLQELGVGAVDVRLFGYGEDRTLQGTIDNMHRFRDGVLSKIA